MAKEEFKFTPKQRVDLLKAGWKRETDLERAGRFLDGAEICITGWLLKTKTTPPTSTKNKIAYAKNIHQVAQEMLEVLEHMPHDVADVLNIGWLKDRYGDNYFRQHSEACRQDTANNLNYLYEVLAHGLAGTDMPTRATELSKLPPNMSKQLPLVIDFLTSLSVSANTMADREKNAKQWQNKDIEKSLALWLALEYETVFGKVPSKANGSNFRLFAAKLSKILGYDLGASVVAYACETVKTKAEATSKS